MVSAIPEKEKCFQIKYRKILLSVYTVKASSVLLGVSRLSCFYFALSAGEMNEISIDLAHDDDFLKNLRKKSLSKVNAFGFLFSKVIFLFDTLTKD